MSTIKTMTLENQTVSSSSTSPWYLDPLLLNYTVSKDNVVSMKFSCDVSVSNLGPNTTAGALVFLQTVDKADVKYVNSYKNPTLSWTLSSKDIERVTGGCYLKFGANNCRVTFSSIKLEIELKTEASLFTVKSKVDIGKLNTVTISAPDFNRTHTLRFEKVGGTRAQVYEKAGISATQLTINYAVPLSWDSSDTTAHTFNVKVTLTTYVQGAQVGSPSTATYTVNCPAGQHTMSSDMVGITVSRDKGLDANGNVVSGGGTYNLQNLTKLTLNGTGIGAYGDQPKFTLSYTVGSTTVILVNEKAGTLDKTTNKYYVSWAGTIPTNGKHNYTLKVTDRFGNTQTKTGSFEMIAYEPPRLLSYSVTRAANPDSMTLTRTYHKITFIAYPVKVGSTNRNSIKLTWASRVHKDSGTANNYSTSSYNELVYPNSSTGSLVKTLTGPIEQTISISSDVFRKSGKADEAIATASRYDFKLQITDNYTTRAVGNMILEALLGTVSVFMRWDKTLGSFGFGAYPTSSNSLAIAPGWQLWNGNYRIIGPGGNPAFARFQMTGDAKHNQSNAKTEADPPGWKIVRSENKVSGGSYYSPYFTAATLNLTNANEPALNGTHPVIRFNTPCVADIGGSIRWNDGGLNNATKRAMIRLCYFEESSNGTYKETIVDTWRVRFAPYGQTDNNTAAVNMAIPFNTVKIENPKYYLRVSFLSSNDKDINQIIGAGNETFINISIKAFL